MAEDNNILSGGVAELEQMKEKIQRRDQGKVRMLELGEEKERLNKEIKIKEKAYEEETTSTHKKRKEEISTTYEKELDKINQKRKAAKDKKDRQKTQKVSERMKEQTSSDIVEQGKMRQSIKELFKQNHVPSVLNRKLYYSLISPSTISDGIIILISMLVVLVVIPCGIYFCIPDKKIWYLIALYIGTVILFGAPYLYLYGKSKDKYWSTIQSAKAIRAQIRALSKKIKATERGIKKDKDESIYGLDHFDAEIAEIEKQLDDVTKSKERALVAYEKEAGVAVTGEIKSRYQPDIDSLKAQYKSASDEKKNLEQEGADLTLEMASKYEAYLGKEFVSVDKADKLIEMFGSKRAANVSDAIQKYRQGDVTQ